MKAKKLRLKGWVSTLIYLSVITAVFISMIFVSNVLESKYGESSNLSYIFKEFIDTDVPVINYSNDSVIKPFDKDNISIDIDFYDKDSSEKEQEKSLILYENTYMPNSGILYTSSNQFDILCTLDGKVTNIKKDDLLGNVIEITHSNSLVTTYYSVDNMKVTVGQTLNQGDIIATSGKNNISSTSNNMLLFEVSLNGVNINPENYYKTSIEDLNK